MHALHTYATSSQLISTLFFFNYTATTEIYTLSLHDALPIFHPRRADGKPVGRRLAVPGADRIGQRLPEHRQPVARPLRSEEHTSELQSHSDLVCRLLLEKKKKRANTHKTTH